MRTLKYKINGREVTRREFLRKRVGGSGAPMASQAYSMPLISDGIGCMKAQVPALRELVRRHNIQGVKVKDNGQLEITSRRGRRELLRARGLVDNDGGYGD